MMFEKNKNKTLCEQIAHYAAYGMIFILLFFNKMHDDVSKGEKRGGEGIMMILK